MSKTSSSRDEKMPSENEWPSAPIWFWIASVLALVWNLMGLTAFGSDCFLVNNEDALSKLAPELQELYQVQPPWVWIAYGIAVIGGVVGSTLLLLRRKLALAVLIGSLLGVLLQSAYMYLLSDTMKVQGSAAMIFNGIIVSIAGLLVVLAAISKSRRWLQ